jgi:hypothetical protein
LVAFSSPRQTDFCPVGHFDHLREREQFLAFLPFYKAAVGANQVPKKAKGWNVHSFFIALLPMLPRKNGGVEQGDLKKQRQRIHASVKATTFPIAGHAPRRPYLPCLQSLASQDRSTS